MVLLLVLVNERSHIVIEGKWQLVLGDGRIYHQCGVLLHEFGRDLVLALLLLILLWLLLVLR